MSFATLELQIARQVARVRLNRPHVHNALDEALIAELTEALRGLDSNDAVRVIVLSGRGKSFCSGGDLKWMEQAGNYTLNERLRDAHSLAVMLKTIRRLSKPIVARIQGAALGAGTGLVAACDIAIAARSAYFGTTEVRFGLIPDVIAPYFSAAVGLRAAARYLLTGDRITGEEAHRLGLIHELTALETLDLRVEATVQSLLSGGPSAQVAVKRLLRKEAISPSLDEAQEGVLAFVEKRRPIWCPAATT